MSGAFIPVWIIGGPFLGLLFLSLMYRGGSSAGSRMDLSQHDPYEDWSDADRRAERTPDPRAPRREFDGANEWERSADVGAIAQLSAHVSPGAIAEFSRPVAPGSISRLSGPVAPGTISRLSRRVSPGAISRLSGHTNPGAVATLSGRRPPGSISRLSAGWFFSNLFGLPLLTRSQSPLEPDETLLISDRPHHRG